MLTGLDVRNFRGIRQLTIEPLGRVNLIAGKNGAGKTAVLESFWIHSGPDSPELAVRISAFRGLAPPNADSIFVDLFNEFDIGRQIEIVGRTQAGSIPRTLRISLNERSSQTTRLRGSSESAMESHLERSTQLQSEGRYEIVFDYLHDNGRRHKSRAWFIEETLGSKLNVPVPIAVSSAGVSQSRDPVPGRPNSVFMGALHRNSLEEDAKRYGELQLRGNDSEILAVLRKLEPRLQSIAPILINNAPVIHANIGAGTPIAARLLGEGFNRTFSMVVSMESTRGGMLLIDEIENGLHHTVMTDVFSNLLELATKFDVQVVATTHSAECIRAAYQALGQNNGANFTFHRIDRVEGHTKATYFDHDMLDTAIRREMEVR